MNAISGFDIRPLPPQGKTAGYLGDLQRQRRNSQDPQTQSAHFTRLIQSREEDHSPKDGRPFQEASAKQKSQQGLLGLLRSTLSTQTQMFIQVPQRGQAPQKRMHSVQTVVTHPM